MSLEINCSKCRRELEIPGGILFGPSSTHYGGSLHYSPKFHLCVVCCDQIITAILANKEIP